jgi:hypothetical protein
MYPHMQFLSTSEHYPNIRRIRISHVIQRSLLIHFQDCFFFWATALWRQYHRSSMSHD